MRPSSITHVDSSSLISWGKSSSTIGDCPLTPQVRCFLVSVTAKSFCLARKLILSGILTWKKKQKLGQGLASLLTMIWDDVVNVFNLSISCMVNKRLACMPMATISTSSLRIWIKNKYRKFRRCSIWPSISTGVGCRLFILWVSCCWIKKLSGRPLTTIIRPRLRQLLRKRDTDLNCHKFHCNVAKTDKP